MEGRRDGGLDQRGVTHGLVGTTVDAAVSLSGAINYLCRKGGGVKMRLKGQSPKCQKRQKANDKCAH